MSASSASLVASGRAEYINDTGADPRAIQIAGTDKQEDERLMVAPLLAGKKVKGVMAVWRTGNQQFTNSDLDFLVGLSLQATVAIENARLFAQSEKRATELATINTVSQQLAGKLELAPLLDLVGEQIRTVFNADVAYVALYNPDTGVIDFPYQFGDDLKPLKFGEGLTSRIIESSKALIINHEADRRGLELGARIVGKQALSYLGVPIPVGGSTLGVISVQSTQKEGVYGADDERLLSTIAANVGVALQNARLFNETQESLSHQTATADILRVISSSPTDVQPVFDAIVGTALKLMSCDFTALLRSDGNTHETVASATPGGVPLPLGKRLVQVDPARNFPSRVIRTKAMLHVPDWAATELPPAEQEVHELTGVNSSLMLPLVRKDECIGVLVLARDKAGAFDDKEIALAKSFVDQAVIAIENVRLFNETREALERQTATADVLQVISGSMADPKPVFDKILDSCERLFGATDMSVCLAEGNTLRIGAYRGGFNDEVLRVFPRPLAGTMSDMTMRLGSVLHRDSVAAAEDLPEYMHEMTRRVGDFSIANAPMSWEGHGIGTIDIARRPPRPFTESELALLKTFADQAVIAIQNARLFNETKESLERQTATAEVLKVISESPTDVQPVFDIIAERAALLTGAESGIVFRFDGELIHMASSYGMETEFIAMFKQLLPVRSDAFFISAEAIRKGVVINVPDLQLRNPEGTAPKGFKEVARRAGLRGGLAVPMFRDRQVVGAIAMYRSKPGKFEDNEVDLLRAFASQAVIAIENVRLFNETKVALERQTATSEVLSVISKSPTDVQPVLEAVAERAGLLCRADGSRVWLIRDGQLHAMTSYGPAFQDGSTGMVLPLRRSSIAGRSVIDGTFVHVDDVLPLIDTEYPDIRDLQARIGFRTALNMPLLLDGEAKGVISLLRNEVRPFSPAEIGLLQTFADQAVIAIQNVRLFNETQEALARQTATSDVLQVISESQTDVQPVFDIIAERAAALTSARYCLVTRLDGDALQLVALHGVNEAGSAALRAAWPQPLRQSTSIAARAIRERRVVNVADLLALSRRRVRPGNEARLRAGRLPQRAVGAAPARPAGHRRHHRQSRGDGPLCRTRKSPCCRLSPAKRWWPSRTCACSTRRTRRWNSRPRRPKCCRSSAVPWPIPRRCSRRSSTAADACLRASSSR